MDFTTNLEDKGANYGFIDHNKLLEYVSEEDIFELVFNFKPEEYDYVTSPFRDDKNPGCWFERNIDGKLKFKDFGSQTVIRGKTQLAIDCFDAVQIYYKLPSYYATLKFIQDKLILGKQLEKREKLTFKQKEKVDFEFAFESRDLLLEDKYFWQDRYGILREHLIEDKVFCVSEYTTRSSKGTFTYYPHDITYCYTEFKSGNKKLYRPFNNKRFITNCKPNDIGGLHKYRKDTKKLVITKSYKDWRVLTNLNINSIWFQSESMHPNLELLLSFCFNHQEIIVFFDNDETGITNAIKLTELINSYFPGKAKSLVLPVSLLPIGISDPSDLRHIQGQKSLINFCVSSKLLNN